MPAYLSFYIENALNTTYLDSEGYASVNKFYIGQRNKDFPHTGLNYQGNGSSLIGRCLRVIILFF